jgi:uncharacterized membrane protein
LAPSGGTVPPHSREGFVSITTDSIEVQVPVHQAYEQLAQLADYPRFMSTVTQARAVDKDTSHWVMALGDGVFETDVRITERTLDEHLAVQSIDGPRFKESMTFQQITDASTLITAELDIDAKAMLPRHAPSQEILKRQLRADLGRLKEYVEQLADDGGPNLIAGSATIQGTDGARRGSAAIIDEEDGLF